jgi:nucleoside-diphosphate-sugar epimerase
MAEDHYPRLTDRPEAFRGERVLVTGATGFIGRWVAGALSACGAEVVVTARDRNLMAGLVRDYEIAGSVVEADLSRDTEVESLVRDVKPACTFNLAGYGVDPSEREPAVAERLNVHLPATLATVVSRHRVASWPGAHLVHVGSALEYGSASGDLDESTVGQPTTLYGRTKLGGTTHLLERSARGDLRVVVARLFTVYGPGEDPRRLLPSLIAAAGRSDSLPLTSGNQRRDFTYVADVAEGLLRLAGCDARGGVVVNLATGRLTAVREFCLAAADALGITSDRLVFGALPTRPEEMSHDPVSIARLRAITGWVPPTTIREGVRATLDFLRSRAPSPTGLAASDSDAVASSHPPPAAPVSGNG